LNFEIERVLRRLKPTKRLSIVGPRPGRELSFLGRAEMPGAVLYDTTVYIDLLNGRFPGAFDDIITRAGTWHSSSALAELASAFGRLRPDDPRSLEAWARIEALFALIPSHRVLTSGRTAWLEAGILSGLLGRVARYATSDRRRVLNDALIFATARKHGLTILTRNIVDFDLLQQLDRSGRVLFYERV
jgi:predicted nucleic acid-binding protein